MDMPALEELEHRVARLETIFEDVLKERINLIAARLDQIYEKTERDKTEILAKTERDKTELIEKIANLYAKTEKDKSEILTKTEKDKSEILIKTEKDKTEILAKTEKDKKELIKWMIVLLVGFSTIIISAIGIVLSLALK